MKYFLWLAALGPRPRLSISKVEYDALGQAWSTILALLSFEEEFDSVIQNYIDLEIGFLNTAMHFMIIMETDLKEYRRVRLKFARLLSNLLSSCRSYLDHSPHHLKKVGSDVPELFTQQTNSAYDCEFAYRFLEALRNYAQHRSSPLHGTTFDRRRVEREDDRAHLQFSMWASVSAAELRADKKFKRSVAAELADTESVDVLAMCRIYIEKIGQIHDSIRKCLSDRTCEARDLLRNAVERYERETGQGKIGVSFCRSKSDRQVDEHQAIPLDVIDLYDDLVSKNRHVVNLRHRFVSSELLPERDRNIRRH